MKKAIITILAAVICAINVNAQDSIIKNGFFKDVYESYVQYEEFSSDADLAEFADTYFVSMGKFYLFGTISHRNAFLSLNWEDSAVIEKVRQISTELAGAMKIIANFDSYTDTGKQGAVIILEEHSNKIDSIEDELFALVNNK